MGLNLGNTNIGEIYLGNTKIAEAYLGSTKVYKATPAIQWDGFIFQFKWNPQKDENITVEGLKADNVSLTTSDIYQGKCNSQGTESLLTSTEISDAINGNLGKYCRLLEFWIKKPNATSLTWHTNMYYQPSGNCLVNIWKYSLAGFYDLVVEDEVASMSANTNYIYNV